jgi:CheY-like chemotaxis protein
LTSRLAENSVPPPLPPPKPPPGKLPLPNAPPAQRNQQVPPPPPPAAAPPSRPLLAVAAPASQLSRLSTGRPQTSTGGPPASVPGPRPAAQSPAPAQAAQPPPPPPAAAQTAAAQPAPAAGTKVILVAEDDISIRSMVSRALRPQYHVYEVVDGQHALDLLDRIKPPDLMILDITMPHVNGLAVAAKAKGDPKLKSVPIIFLSGLDSPRDVIEGIKAGARHYVTKPFNMNDLLAKIVKTIGAGK